MNGTAVNSSCTCSTDAALCGHRSSPDRRGNSVYYKFFVTVFGFDRGDGW
jgi:hypothetical protein